MRCFYKKQANILVALMKLKIHFRVSCRQMADYEAPQSN